MHLDVVLLLGLVRCIVAQRQRAGEGAGIEELSKYDGVIRNMLQSIDAAAAPITGPWEYFLGDPEKAKAECEASLQADSGAWDLLLCCALCQ